MRAFTKVLIKICGGAIVLGILLVIIGFSSGAADDIDWRKDFANNENLYDFNEDYSDVKSIDIDLQYGEVQIKKGDTFRIEGYNLWKDRFKSEVKDGVWKISDEGFKGTNHWSFRVWPLNFGYHSDYTPDITIYVPQDFKAYEFSLQMDAGSVEIESLTAILRTKMSVGAGEIIVNELDAINADIKCGAGKIELAGNITGDVNVDCNVGKVELNLDGKESDYDYEVECNLGSVSINDKDYEFSTSINRDSDSAVNKLDLICNVGEIVVNTN